MSSVPSEPERYSIDEMMDRLKNATPGNPEDGELVTRSDGTQAIRVRKRKRRSKQPQKEDSRRGHRARIVQVSAALLLVFLAALALGGGVVYSNSSAYREKLVKHISEASGATATLETFRMNPKTANSGNLLLQWPEGNVMKSLALRGLVAEVFPSSFFGKTFSGEEISVIDATLTLQAPEEGKAARVTAAPPAGLPIDFKRYRAANFQLAWGESATSPFKLVKSEAVLAAKATSGRPQLSLYKGELLVTGWPKLRVNRSLIEFRGEETDIIGLRLLHETDERGSLEFSGIVAPLKPDHRSSLSVELKAFELSGITGNTLGRLLSGRVDSSSSTKSNFLAFSSGADSAPILDATFVSTPSSTMEVRGFPFLFALSQLLNDEWFEHPMFDGESTGVIHREKGAVSLRNLDLQAKNRLALRGEMTLAANDSLSGSLRLGLTDAMITTSVAPFLRSLFGPVTEGYRWVDLEISGTGTSPKDDFQTLFSEVTKKPAPPPSRRAPGGSSFEELTSPPK